MPPARIVLWGTSLGGIASLAACLLNEPPLLWLAAATLLAYLLVATCGVIFPHLEMHGDVVWRGTSGVALTFDDGPDPESTRRVLRILAERGHTATFFVVGRKVDLHADVMREIHGGGHGIGLHGYLHERFFSFKTPKFVCEDIARTQSAVEAACGVRPTLFRPPVGHVSSSTAKGAISAGVTLVAWSVRAFDGIGRPCPDRVVRRISRGLRPGAIVQLHDAAENGGRVPSSVDALPRILDLIEQRGLTTQRVDALVRAETMSPGREK